MCSGEEGIQEFFRLFYANARLNLILVHFRYTDYESLNVEKIIRYLFKANMAIWKQQS